MTCFIICNLDRIELAFKDLKECIKRKLSEEENVRKYLTQKAVKDGNRARILWLFDLKKPSYSVREMSGRLNVTKSAAQKTWIIWPGKAFLSGKK